MMPTNFWPDKVRSLEVGRTECVESDVTNDLLIIRVIFCGDYNNSTVTVSMISAMSHKQ